MQIPFKNISFVSTVTNTNAHDVSLTGNNFPQRDSSTIMLSNSNLQFIFRDIVFNCGFWKAFVDFQMNLLTFRFA